VRELVSARGSSRRPRSRSLDVRVSLAKPPSSRLAPSLPVSERSNDDDLPSDGTVPGAEASHAPRSTSRLVRPSGRWQHLPTIAAFVGLVSLPIAGTIYATAADFGRAASKSSAAPSTDASDGDDKAAEPDDAAAVADDDPATSRRISRGASNKSKSTAGTKRRSSSKPKPESAGLCCAKLHELGKVAELSLRPSYLAAASACEAAPDRAAALTKVATQLKVSGADLPPECEP
jgi:hypothetical protein